jgi:hypothetical protein
MMRLVSRAAAVEHPSIQSSHKPNKISSLKSRVGDEDYRQKRKGWQCTQEELRATTNAD